MSTASLDSRIERWQQSLLDLTLRNRLLNFKPQGAVQILLPAPEITFDLLSGEKTLTIREAAPSEVASGKEKHNLDRLEVLVPHDPKGLDGTLRRLRLKARGAVQEQGVNILYLAFGTVRWYETEGSEDELLAPLLLVPVELIKEGPLQPYRLRAIDDEVVANPTLAYKLSTDYRLTLPEWDEDQGSLSAFFKEVRLSLAPLKKWSVEETAYLGLFSFAKLSMYKEMNAYRPVMEQHPVINALAGDRTKLPAIPDYPRAERLDENVRPIGSFQILDADSSQQEAVEMAKRGISFVLQGPPGTGKSQTIANIIAESLAADKRVLFVSEKMAALEVVKRRLDDKGLGDYLLEMHSHKANKAEIIEELRRSAQPMEVAGVPVDDLARLEKVRASLNGYVQALHQMREPMRISAFQAYGVLASLHDVAPLPVPVPDVGALRPEDLDERLRTVRRVEAMQKVIARMDDHPWRDLNLEGWKGGDEVMVEATLRELRERVEKVKAKGHELASFAGLDDPRNLVEARRLTDLLRRVASTPFPMEAWMSPGLPGELLNKVEECRRFYTMRQEQAKWLAERYDDSVLSVETAAMLDRFKGYSGFFRFLNGGYKKDVAELSGHAKDGRTRKYGEALADLRQINKIRKDGERTEGVDKDGAASFGERFKGERTDWEELQTSLMWSSQLLNEFGPLVTRGVVALAVDPNGRSSRLPGPIREAELEMAQLQQVLERLNHHFLLDDRLSSPQAVSFDRYEDLTVSHLADLSILKEWVEACELERTCQKGGLSELFALARRKGLPSGDLSEAYRKRTFQLWMDAVTDQDTRLRDFRSVEHEEAVDQFRQLDVAQMDIAQRRLRERLNVSRNALLSAEGGKGSELAALRHELGKKKRFKQLRQLFRECPNVILQLKPCLLMSPLSVSQYLDPVLVRFDVIIFDEASQVRPEDAVGSIMRGSQLIVVGDSKQLPPTAFFRADSGDDDEAEEEDLESILDECAALDIKQHMLLWHYRSRNESLIAFSNRHIYDSRLYTFPSASSNGERGVSLVSVANGVYGRGGSRTNPAEAKKVAELVFEHFTKRPELSLGVVAFSEAQQLEILDQLDQLRRKRPEYEKYFVEGSSDEFFVKNLENVQGDERDVMIFSVGYGKDEKGKMFQNFGPLNKPGGERRMNVAITRAKRRVIVVSSITADDIDGSAGAGPHLLKEYLRYAASGGDREVLVKGKNGTGEVSPLEDEVFKALTTEGLQVQRRIGCSGYRIDLAVEDPSHPGSFLLGIECDGASYRSGKTARDRDRLRAQVLEGLGWKVHRIWSKDWVDDPHKELEKVKEALRAGGASAIEAIPAESDATPNAPTGAAVEASVDLVATLLTIVNEQGPVHQSEAKEALRRLAPNPQDIDILFNASEKALAADGSVVVREQFLWPMGMDKPPLRKPAGTAPRDLEMVSLEEIGEAVLFSFRSDIQVTRSSLINRTAFFYRTETPFPKVRTRIGQAVDRLEEAGRIVDVGDEVMRRTD